MNKDEGTGIIYKKWAHLSPRAVFLLVHGLGGHSGRWDLLADFFLSNSISSYAIELRGFGETKDDRGHIDSFDIYFSDIRSLREAIKKENSGKKIFLMGESLGALICFLLAGLDPWSFDGLVCLSAAFKNRLKFTLWDYITFLVFLLFYPKKPIKMPFDSSMCTRDTEYLKAMDLDPKEYRFATAKLLLNIRLAQMRVNYVKNNIKIPTLFLIAGDHDEIADPEAVQEVFRSLPSKEKEIIRYPDMVHALSVDIGREKVFADISNWVNRRCL